MDQVHKKYDLKGSTVDREASEKERGKSLPTLKVDFFMGVLHRNSSIFRRTMTSSLMGSKSVSEMKAKM